MKKKDFIFIMLVSFFIMTSCSEEFEQPYSQQISASESGLIGIWEGVRMEKNYAVVELDSLGNTVTDDKGKNVWLPNQEIFTENEWNEYIQFQSIGSIDTFSISSDLDSLNSGVLMPVINMPLEQGYWAVINTINPEGEKEDATSINFYDPADPHNSLSSILWTVREQSADEITIQYSFGSTTYDTLFIKTFRKI